MSVGASGEATGHKSGAEIEGVNGGERRKRSVACAQTPGAGHCAATGMIVDLQTQKYLITEDDDEEEDQDDDGDVGCEGGGEELNKAVGLKLPEIPAGVKWASDAGAAQQVLKEATAAKGPMSAGRIGRNMQTMINLFYFSVQTTKKDPPGAPYLPYISRQPIGISDSVQSHELSPTSR